MTGAIGVYLICALIGLAFCFGVAALWDNKGHSYAGGFWFSFFLTPVLGLIVGLLMQNVPKPLQNNNL